MPRVVSVDIGTSSVRARAFDDAAEPAGELVQASYDPPPRDADALVALTRDVIARAGGGDVLAVSAFWHSLLLLDERDRPLAPISSWLDADALDDARALADEVDERATYRRTGAPLHASFWPAKLRRLAREGVTFARAVSFPDYLRLRLGGALETSVSLASGTGLFDVHALRWDDELLRVLGLDEAQLPPVSDDGVWLGDGAAANLGSGCVARERACLTVGTSAAYRVVHDGAPEVHDGLFAYRVDRARAIEGGAFSNGGNVLVWVARTFGAMEADLETPPGPVTFLPLLAGERSPRWNASARAALCGLSLETTGADVLKAALEGMAYRLADVAERIPGVELVVGGGAALRSRAGWGQLIADVLQLPVVLSASAETSLRGAAVAATGVDPAAAPLGTRFEPRDRWRDEYAAARARQRALYDATAAEPTS